ncbi:MAG: glycosyltransferase family 4 protein [Methanoregula sp.]|jgi:glycosyltransferase involved in cell wall biosynthesis|uniref:glycosyltransferase family 4 protein n=1 Tax=Methanoregula sp. TaxID=2052170 RepID=UPI003D0BD122
MESCKVAFFCWESLYAERVGGLANAATNLAETLVKQNHEVHYFTRGSIPDQTINGVQYHYCRPYGQNIVEYCNDMSKAMVSQFRTHDSPGKFDFLHFHDWHPVQALHYLQDRNTILTYHSTEYGRNGNQFGDWWEFREISGKEWYGGLIAKRVTAVSATLRNEVMTLYNVPEEKCEVIPNGIVPRAYRASIDPGEVKASYGIHPYAPLILFIGRLVYQKGPDLLIEAIRKVCQHRGDAKVVVAGTGDMRQFLQDRAKDLPVNFVGYIPDSEYIRLLNAADVVVIPSRNEPFGLVLLEAWSAEKCVVASNVGGLSENIDAFVNGIKVGVDPDSIAWGISTMVDEPWNAGALGIRGRNKVDRLFLWGPIVQRLTGAYSRVVA